MNETKKLEKGGVGHKGPEFKKCPHCGTTEIRKAKKVCPICHRNFETGEIERTSGGLGKTKAKKAKDQEKSEAQAEAPVAEPVDTVEPINTLKEVSRDQEARESLSKDEEEIEKQNNERMATEYAELPDSNSISTPPGRSKGDAWKINDQISNSPKKDPIMGISSPRINLLHEPVPAQKKGGGGKLAKVGKKIGKGIKSALDTFGAVPEEILNDEIESYETGQRKSGNESKAPKINLLNNKLEVRQQAVREVANNIRELNLGEIFPEGFEDLSEAQKLKVTRDLKKKIVDIVKTDAETQYSETTKGKWKAIVGGITKAKNIKNLEQEIFQKIKTSPEGQELLRENLEILIENTKGKEIKISPEGVALINFLSPDDIDNPSKEELSALVAFNLAANKYAALPYEHGQEKSGKNKKKFNKAQEEYIKARAEIQEMMSKKEDIGEKGKALLRTTEIDYAVEMEQFLSTHPEYEKEIQDFARSAGATELLKTTGGFLNTITGGKNWTNKLLTVGGFGARMAAKGAAIASSSTIITALAAPIIGGAIGGLRANIRAKETLTTKKKLSRHGTKDESAEATNTVDISNLNKRMGDLLKSLEESTTDEEREKRIDQLKRRMAYIDEKMEAGLVNFGDAKSSLKNQFDLIKNINTALVVTSASGVATNEEMEKRLEQFLATKASKIEGAQKIFIKKQMKRGAILGASFAIGGYGVRWLGEYMGWWGDQAEATTSATNANTDQSQGFFDRAEKWFAEMGKKINIFGEDTSEDIALSPKPEASSSDVVAQELPKSSRNLSDVMKDAPGVKSGDISQELPKPSQTLGDMMKNAPGTLPEKIEVNPDAIIRKGEGIEHALRRQILANPEIAKNYGFKEGMDIKAMAGKIAHRMALDHGYVDKVTGEEIRISVGGGEVAYQTQLVNGEVTIYEVNAKTGIPVERHGDESGFEGDKKEGYEYRTSKKATGAGELGAVDERPFETGRTLADVMPKSEKTPEIAEEIKLPQEEHVARVRAEIDEKYAKQAPNTIQPGPEMRIGGGGPDMTHNPNYVQGGAHNIEFQGNQHWPQGARGPGYNPENIGGGHPDGGVNTFYHTGGNTHGGSFYDNGSREAIIANKYGRMYEGRFSGEKYFPDISPEQNRVLKFYPEFYKNPYGLSGDRLYHAWEIHNKNLFKVFPEETSERWTNVRLSGAKDIFYTNPADAEDGMPPLINYMRKLNQVTGLVPDKDLPKRGFFSFLRGPKTESTEEYIARALQRAAEMGRLKEVMLEVVPPPKS